MRLVLEPLGYGFFPRALLAAVLVLVLGALAGPGVRARRQVYLGHGVSQAMLLGVAVASVQGTRSWLVPLTATLAATLAAGLVALLERHLEPDVAIAVVGGGMLAVGVTVLSRLRERTVNVSNLLFGNVLGVSWSDVAVLGATVALTGVFYVGSARRLALLGVSREVAVAHGVRVRRLELLQTIAVAASVAAFVQVAGTLLAVSALVLPTAIAQLRSRTLVGVHVIGALAAIVGAVAGLYVSYWTDVPSGPALSLVLTTVLLVTLVAPRRSR